MHALVRKLREDERGQALVVAAVSMLVLVVMVLGTISVGSAVHEKMKLQDAADAQAYSTAVKEARAYNFIAYLNRAMVVHYNAMLTLMGYLSHALYLDATVGNAAKFLKLIPYVGAIFSAVEQAISAWKSAVDMVTTVVIPILTYLNVAMWVAQEAVVGSTFLDILAGAAEAPVTSTDKKAYWGYKAAKSSYGTVASFMFQAANAVSFAFPLDDGPHSKGTMFNTLMTYNWADPTGLGKRAKQFGRTKLSDPDTAKYRLLMNNIVNGARRQWTAEGKGPFLIGRKWDFSFCFGIGKLMIDKWADTRLKSFHEQYNGNIKDQLYSLDAIRIRVKGPSCWLGKTKTVFEFRTDVAADFRQGYHRRSFSSRAGAVSDRHHFWQGITPFIHSDPSFIQPQKHHFSYPCNMAVVTKDMVKPAIYNLKTSYLAGQGRKDGNGLLDMSFGSLSRVAGGTQWNQVTGGMAAISVGRAVYHRPGVWKEEPNFFNPLWTARLAPVRTHWSTDILAAFGAMFLPLAEATGPGAFNY